MKNERVKTQEAVQKTTSHIPRALLEAHAPPKKDWEARKGHWTQKDMKRFQQKLEDLYKNEHEGEKQVTDYARVDDGHRSTSISSGMEASRALRDPQGNVSKAFASSSAPTLTRYIKPRDQQHSHDGSSVRTDYYHHTEVTPVPRSSDPSATNVNNIANSSALTLGLMADATTCTQTQAHKEVDQRAHDLKARQRRNHEHRRLLARMEAANRAHANRKATAELQQITKGMQNMRISHVGGGVSAPPVRLEIRPSPSANSNQQAERVNTVFMPPDPTNNGVLFATKQSLFVSGIETNDGNRSEGTLSHKHTQKLNYGQPIQDTSTTRDATAIRTIEEVDRARKMQELHEQFLNGRMLATDALASVKSHAQDDQNNKAYLPFFKDTGAESTHTMLNKDHFLSHPNDDQPRRPKSDHHPCKRAHFHPTDMMAVPKPLCLDPAPTAAAADDANLDLYGPPSPRVTFPPARGFTDIPLSSPPHQGSLENDFVEVDVEELDGLEWEVINA
ncbi:hypothetical protein DPSP01_009611 [Paraphaeosphaeria sporulosa]